MPEIEEGQPGQPLGEFSREDLRAEAVDDYTRSVVPLNKRRSTLSMTLIWITGNAAFSTLYTGYALHQGGLSLYGLLAASLVGNGLLLIYWLGACYLGARFGQTETLLARTIMGRWGSILVSAFIVVATLGWYSFQADLLGTAITSLLGISSNIALISLFAGIIMMTNNLFGFTSVSVWARYVTAPILVIWIVITFVKVFSTESSAKLFAAPHIASSIPFGLAAGTFIGAIIWGAEPDFWRWSKPSFKAPIIPCIVAILLGNVMFPLAGAALVEVRNITAFGSVITFASQYSLRFVALGVLVFIITQIAVNDMNLYEVVTALKNMFPGPRFIYVLLAGSVGALFAYFQVIQYYQTIANLTGILVPSITVVMIMDAFLLPRWLGLRRRMDRVTEWRETALLNWPGAIAVAAAVVVGGFTAGIFKSSFSWGIGPLNAWVVASVVYLALVVAAKSILSEDRLRYFLGYPNHNALPADGLPHTQVVAETTSLPADGDRPAQSGDGEAASLPPAADM